MQTALSYIEVASDRHTSLLSITCQLLYNTVKQMD